MSPSAPAFDTEHFRDIAEHLGRDTAIEAVGLFLSTCDRHAANAAHGDLAPRLEAAHTLKGMSLQLGLGALGEACHEIERACRDGSLTNAEAAAVSLPASLAEAKRLLAKAAAEL